MQSPTPHHIVGVLTAWVFGRTHCFLIGGLENSLKPHRHTIGYWLGSQGNCSVEWGTRDRWSLWLRGLWSATLGPSLCVCCILSLLCFLGLGGVCLALCEGVMWVWKLGDNPSSAPPSRSHGAGSVLRMCWLVHSQIMGCSSFLLPLGCRVFCFGWTYHCWRGWLSWMVPVGPGGKSYALLEVCCMTLAQHTSTNCDPAWRRSYGPRLMLRRGWRPTSLLCVRLLDCFDSGVDMGWQTLSQLNFPHIHLYGPQWATHTHTLHHHCLSYVFSLVSLSVLSFCAPLSVILVLWQNQGLGS